MALPPGFLDEIRNRVSLVRIVGRRVAWDPRKSNAARGDYWASCPFHQEKSASFHVEDAKGAYYCFGCHAKGDAVTFLRETENLGFMEAVERLAAEAGMEMPDRDPAAAERAAAARGLAEAMEAAVRFYRAQLTGARAAEARAYLDRRGIRPETRERFEIGYAPDGRTALLDHLTGKGFARDRLVEAGLVGQPRDGGAPYDRFRGRIMFPIRDPRGRAIAFGARALAAGREPKYLNSPDTPLFDKGRVLYNLGPAQTAARKAGTLVVTEGYVDVIALAQAGIDHAVAGLGTAIGEHQLGLLWKAVPEPIVALDGDAAGLAAAHRLIDLSLPLLGPGRSLRFSLMPAGQDPDDVVRGGGARAMQALLAASRPVVDLIWARETDRQVLDSPERRAALDARLKAHLGRIADPSLRGHWEREIRARRTQLFAPPARPTRKPPPGGAARQGARGGRPIGPVAPTPSTKASLLARQPDEVAAKAQVWESAILAGCINHPSAALALEHRLEGLVFHSSKFAEIRGCVLSALAEPLDTTLAERVAVHLGRDPLPELAANGWVLASRYLHARADTARATRAIEEMLNRHVALTGRAAEIEEANAEAALAGELDEAIVARVRDAGEAEILAHMQSLEGDDADQEAEHLEFAREVRIPDASKSRRPRKR